MNVQRVINDTSLTIISVGIMLSDRSDHLLGAIIGLGTIGIGVATMLFGNLVTIPIKAKKKIIKEVGEFDKNYEIHRGPSLNLYGESYGIGLPLNF